MSAMNARNNNKYFHSLDIHLLLLKSSFKIPLEVIKQNFRSLTKLIEKQNQTLLLNINKLVLVDSKSEKLNSLHKIVKNYELFLTNLKKKIDEHNEFVSRIETRFKKLQELEELESNFSKNKDDINPMSPELLNWHRDQINLLINNYLLRSNDFKEDEPNSGLQLIYDLNFNKLIDYDVIINGLKIYQRIKNNKDLSVLIEWCNENKKNLKTMSNNSYNLEFETYYQKFIELIKNNEIFKGLEIAKKILINDDSLIYRNGKSSIGTTTGINSNGIRDGKNFTKKASNIIGNNLERLTEISGLILYSAVDTHQMLEQEQDDDDDDDNDAVDGVDDDDDDVSTNLMDVDDPLSYYDQSLNPSIKFNRNFNQNYEKLLSKDKWNKLANFFLYSYNSIYGIEQNLEFLIMLSIGISSLKTKSCYHDIYSKSGTSGNGNNDIENKEDANEKDVDDRIDFKQFIPAPRAGNAYSTGGLLKHKKAGNCGKNSTYNGNNSSNTNNDLLVNYTNNCPICSLELTNISKSLPYSHQIMSNIFDNPILLPNGNIYQLDKLLKLNESLLGNSNNVSLNNVSATNSNNKKKKTKSSVSIGYNDKYKKNRIKIYGNNNNLFFQDLKQIYSEDELTDLEEETNQRPQQAAQNDIDSDDVDEDFREYEASSAGDSSNTSTSEEDDDDDEEEEEAEDEDNEDEDDGGDDDDDADYGGEFDEENEQYWNGRRINRSVGERPSRLSTNRNDITRNGINRRSVSGSGNGKLGGGAEGTGDIFDELKLLGKFKLKDPLSGEIFNSNELVRVFPT
ncbi:hypothetical protein PACTADRAFT_3162 [Pachysolen tannophilus NRRL Y-2460]|uniref:RING-Gid-type domain-containing protein n=1 Tax=Pachysolen tannophilus NRRL Y-2460 TaxID=669874 RepID=A0A1E4TUK9_PACTA|nr:hypothetical protein PACTADRAFT_3162 [Pachysolen tannophilus NRRL Y-2460]